MSEKIGAIRNNQIHKLHLGSKDNIKYNRNDLSINDNEVPDLIPDRMNATVYKDNGLDSEGKEKKKKRKYKIQAIEYPIKANGYIYTESFFQSFVDALKDGPMPGSKYGHEMNWGKRPPTDFYLVGGKLQKNGNGSGIVYLKNYIPLIGDNNSSNERFIDDLDLGIVHFSIVAYTRDQLIPDDNGQAIWHVVQFMHTGRNDAVEVDAGAMPQKTNIKHVENSAVGGENITNEREIMTEQDLLTALTEHKNNSLVMPKIFNVLGIEAVTDKHKNAIVLLSEFEKMGIVDPVKEFNIMKSNAEKNALAVHNAILDHEFGISTKENPDLIREQAGKEIKQCANEADYKTAFEDFRNQPLIQKLAAEKANVYSKTNQIGITEKEPGNKTLPVAKNNVVII